MPRGMSRASAKPKRTERSGARIVTIAKRLGGGSQPIGAVILGEHIFAAFRDGSGAFQHGHTYMWQPIAAALAVQQVIERGDLLANGRILRAHLNARLRERFEHPYVGDIRGRGLFGEMEFVSDRGTKAPFDPALRLHARLKAEGMMRGLMIYPMGGPSMASGAIICRSRAASSSAATRSTLSSNVVLKRLRPPLLLSIRRTRVRPRRTKRSVGGSNLEIPKCGKSIWCKDTITNDYLRS